MTVIDTRPTIESMHVGMDEPTLDEVVRDVLPKGKYHSIEEIEGGDGTRRAKFRGMWGRNGGSRPVRIKVDKPLEDSKKQERRDRGYDTSNDATVLSHLPYDEALAHGISPILDYEESNGLVVSVEPEFSGGVSLQEFFKDRKPNKQEFNQVISGLTGAVNYAHHQGFFHRDLNGLNSMIRKRGKNLETRLTDWEFAVPKDRVRDAPFNTSGTKSLRDPLLESRPYGDQAEAYQIAMNALTLFSDEPLSWYDNEELKDPAKRKEAVRKALGEMPKNLRKRHGKWIERSLSLKPEERFGSFEEFYSAVKSAVEPTLWERIMKRKNEIGMSLIAGGMLGGAFGGGIYYHDIKTQERIHQKQLVEANKDKVIPHWNGNGLEITNDKIDLDLQVYTFRGEESQKYPDDSVLRVNPGDKIYYTAGATGEVRSLNDVSGTTILLRGQYYVEGERFEDGSVAKDFSVWTEGVDDARKEYGMGGYWMGGTGEFIVPENWEPGVRNLTFELYAPTKEDLEGEEHYKKSYRDANIHFEKPGMAIERERVKLVVGDPDVKVDVDRIGMKGYTTDVSAKDITEGEISSGTWYSANTDHADYFVAVPELDLARKIDSDEHNRIGGIGLPRAHGPREGIAYFHVRDDDGDIVNYTAIPIRAEGIVGADKVEEGLDQIYWWGFGDIDKGFPQRLVDYKESLPEVDKQEVDESDRQ